MSRWKKVKSLFVVSEETPAGQATAPPTDAELAALELPPGELSSLPPGTDTSKIAGSIDFQPLYDEAGIPDTDEVEALERFLGGLDESLPQASKLAAAKAFLSAIGKSPNDVLKDAAMKIKVVRAVEMAKTEWTNGKLSAHQSEIDALTIKIEEHRAEMQKLQKDLESVRSQCAVEEGRLQGARVFFGAMEKV